MDLSPLPTRPKQKTRKRRGSHNINLKLDEGFEIIEPTAEELAAEVAARRQASIDYDLMQQQEKKDRVYVYGELIDVEEDRENEFKAVHLTKNPIATIMTYCEKYINAFLNSAGGTIHFGIQDDGTIIGLPLNRKERDTLRLRIDAVVGGFLPQVDPYLVRTEFIKVEVPHKRKSKRTDPQEKDEEEINRLENIPAPHSQSILYVVEVRVLQGRAPVYFSSKSASSAYIRREGSVTKMSYSMIEERKRLGRPINTNQFLPYDQNSEVMPSSPLDFIGREKEISLIREFVAKTRSAILTVLLYGPPIVGKSALARRLVSEFSSTYPDRHVFIDLKSFYGKSKYQQAVDLKISVIRTYYPLMRALPKKISEIGGLYESCFTGKSCILTIENVGMAEQLQELVPTSGKRTLIFCTSRHDLDLDAMQFSPDSVLPVKIGALTKEDAVTLLRYVIKDYDGTRLTAEETDEVLSLCGYLPLAIRMVGSMIRRKINVPPSTIIERLKGDERMSLVPHSFVTSFSSYDPQIQQHLMTISVFPGSFDGAAATSVFKESYVTTQDNLGLLLDYGLLDFDVTKCRYQQNDLLRHFCFMKAQAYNGGETLRKWQKRFIKHYQMKMMIELEAIERQERKEEAEKQKEITGELEGTEQEKGKEKSGDEEKGKEKEGEELSGKEGEDEETGPLLETEEQLKHELKDSLLKPPCSCHDQDTEKKMAILAPVDVKEKDRTKLKSSCSTLICVLQRSNIDVLLESLRLFITERHNYEACLTYAETLKDSDLAWWFTHQMKRFTKSLNKYADTMEYQKWEELADPINKRAKEQKEQEKSSQQTAKKTENVLIVVNQDDQNNQHSSDIQVLAQQQDEDKQRQGKEGNNSEANRQEQQNVQQQKQTKELQQKVQELEQQIQQLKQVNLCLSNPEPVPMTAAEKFSLTNKILKLPQENLAKVIEIIHAHAPTTLPNEEIEIDIDSLDASTLRHLECFTDSVLTPPADQSGCADNNSNTNNNTNNTNTNNTNTNNTNTNNTNNTNNNNTNTNTNTNNTNTNTNNTNTNTDTNNNTDSNNNTNTNNNNEDTDSSEEIILWTGIPQN
eukprot:CAMPEP_0174257250 /NCGR_PEP_ID=MMETSP0439-20130205/6412_1 /TAXON_ID=0 /ORGANISM="Stereomyxa ramosa, Strain Chinc5" /LENGTH=1081 /DNA_ID=CAMNT_0015340255 /DNA_START=174 /DNA_END=3419 /DNA_ORIENTATION=+